MSVLKKVTVGVALVATSLAVSVAQAGPGEGRRGDRLRDVVDTIDRIDRIGRGGLRGEMRMQRVSQRLIEDLKHLRRTVRQESRSQGMRGPAARAIEDIRYSIQSVRQLKRVVTNRGLVPKVRRLLRQARQDIRMAVMSVNRVRFVSRYGERQAAITIDDARFKVQKMQRILDNNGVGRSGRGDGRRGGRRGDW